MSFKATSASGRWRIKSNSFLAGTVTLPGRDTFAWAADRSVRSRSVDVKLRCPSAAFSRMLERIGMVFFLSTTPCMSVSSFKKSPLLTVNSMGVSYLRKDKNSITLSSFCRTVEKSGRCRKGPKNGLGTRVAKKTPRFLFRAGAPGRDSPSACGKGAGGKRDRIASPSAITLQKRLDDLAEIRVVFDQALDLFDGMHDRRVMLVVEEPADLGIGEPCQLAAEIHRDL